MQRLSMGLSALAAVGLLAIAMPRNASETAQLEALPPSPDHPSPVVVELFTSQGCSSCPPADRVLSELAERGDVLPLAFHVDYWNYIGWNDPFSSEQWSKRQERYADALRTGRLYTPMVVVDGQNDVVGSRGREVDALIARARQQAQAGEVVVEITPPAEGASTDALDSRWAAQLVGTVERPADFLVAVVESGLETPVRRGENARRTLHNDFVVRRLERLGTVTPGAEDTVFEHRITLDPSWQRDAVRLVGLLQDPETLAIHGAASGAVAPGR